MVIDTSALVAMFRYEPEAEDFSRRVHGARSAVIGAPTKFEFLLVSCRAQAEAGIVDARLMLAKLGISVVDWTDELADLAADALLRYGKGRHPAKLNFGDCMAYALAKSLDAPLLFKGNDFEQTDVRRVTG